MTIRTNDGDRDASQQVLDALKTAPEPLRQAASEAIGNGNLETFTSLVSEFLGPRIPAGVLNRVDWDWLAGEFLAGPDLPAPDPRGGPRP